MKKSNLIYLTAVALGIGIIFIVQVKPSMSLIPETQGIATVVRTNSSHTIGYYGLAQVACKPGEILTGGGYDSPQWREMLSVYRNGPSEDGKKWLVEMMYVGPHYYGEAPYFTIYAVCAKLNE